MSLSVADTAGAMPTDGAKQSCNLTSCILSFAELTMATYVSVSENSFLQRRVGLRNAVARHGIQE